MIDRIHFLNRFHVLVLISGLLILLKAHVQHSVAEESVRVSHHIPREEGLDRPKGLQVEGLDVQPREVVHEVEHGESEDLLILRRGEAI